MSTRIGTWLSFCCLLLVTGCVTEDRYPTRGAAGITAEIQYRPAIDSTPSYVPINFPPVSYNGQELPLGKMSGHFPVLEVFLTNHREQPVEFSRVFLDGEELKSFPNDKIVWWQLYPTAVANAGETVLLQICFDRNPSAPQTLELEAKHGERLALRAPTFVKPPCEIVGVNFDWDMRRAFIAYLPAQPSKSAARPHLVPRTVRFNGKDHRRSVRVMETPVENRPGMIAADLGAPVAIGQPIHCRMEFAGGKVAQCLLRASKGISLDAYGVDQKDEKLRTELGLGLHPPAWQLGEDVACYDQPQRPGYNAPSVLENRRKAYEAGDARLASVFLCVMARPQISFPIYGQCTDVLQVNPYRLQYSGRDTAPKFIEKEENFFRWAWLAARPRPWHWAPEVCLFHKRKFGRIIEPQELRLLTYAALGNGTKGVNYFAYGKFEGEYEGFQESPPLLAEIKKLNSEIKILEPILSHAFSMSIQTISDDVTGTRLYTLWSGDEGVLLIARSLAYETSRQPNELGQKPQFRSSAPASVEVEASLPSWLQLTEVVDPLDPTASPISHRVEGRKIVIAIPLKGGVGVAWLKNRRTKTD